MPRLPVSTRLRMRPLDGMTVDELKLECDACAHQLVGMILAVPIGTIVRKIHHDVAQRAYDAGRLLELHGAHVKPEGTE